MNQNVSTDTRLSMETTKPSNVKSESEEDQKSQNETSETATDTPPLESTDMLQESLKKSKQENLQEEILVSDSSIEEDEEQMKEET